nr:MAG TPA: hypothetical protein [Bacteriophage sp.]DAO65324.1 MAG TPA: hypothetical protein [Caudoviricetes sp.]
MTSKTKSQNRFILLLVRYLFLPLHRLNRQDVFTNS